MVNGFIIMNECNITQNRVKKHNGGYRTFGITSDSYITCVNVIENNQTYGEFNWHTSSESYESSIFKVTSCNYIRNKSPNVGYLICSWNPNIFMSYCCIHENEISYIFWAQVCTITFENSTTDNTTYFDFGNSPIFKNTYISFENKCPLLLLSKLYNSISSNDEIEEENNVFIRINIKISNFKFFHFSYAIMLSLHSNS